MCPTDLYIYPEGRDIYINVCTDDIYIMAKHKTKKSVDCACGGYYLENNKRNHVRSKIHVYYLLYNNDCTNDEFEEFVKILYTRRPKQTSFLRLI